MGPEISQFLAGMRKTMEQVVLPNLSDRFAQEQAGIVAATLAFLEQVHDKVFHYELLEHHLYRRLLGQILELLSVPEVADPETVETLAAIQRRLAEDPPGGDIPLYSYDCIRASNESMKELLCALIGLQPRLPDALRTALEDLLQPFFRDLERRERSWVKPLGFDAQADQLPDIAELLYRDDRLQLPGDDRP
jgi:hypothetical protein